MALIEISTYSEVLKMEVQFQVILPEGKQEDLSVLYLLHGMGGNHSVWTRRTSLERYVKNYNLAVILPSTDLGWYTDTTYDMNYWTFISEELPKRCHEIFPQLTKNPQKTFAGGLSMGGYGAVKLGLRQPERFGAILSFSGALALAEAWEELYREGSQKYWEGIFGPLEAFRGSEDDLVACIQKGCPKQGPKYLITCGTEDELFPASEYVVDQMQTHGFSVTFEQSPGAHDWEYWDEWIQKGLEWLITEQFLTVNK